MYNKSMDKGDKVLDKVICKKCGHDNSHHDSPMCEKCRGLLKGRSLNPSGAPKKENKKPPQWNAAAGEELSKKAQNGDIDSCISLLIKYATNAGEAHRILKDLLPYKVARAKDNVAPDKEVNISFGAD